MKRSEYSGQRDDDELWSELRPQREPVGSRWFLPVVLGALVLSVPWYVAGNAEVVAGLPLWVWASLACSVLLSAVTAFGALRAWSDPEADAPDRGPGTEP